MKKSSILLFILLMFQSVVFSEPVWVDVEK